MSSSDSSLAYTYEHIDDEIDRSFRVAPEIDPSRTALLVLDVQKLIVDPKGAAYVESVAGAPAGKDVVEPIKRVVECARQAEIPVFWSLWGLRPDGLDAGVCTLKWPGLKPGHPDSPASWGNRDAELADGLEPLANEPVVKRSRFSCLSGTAFDEWLRQLDIEYVAIAGVTTANCMHSTTIDLWNRNYKVIVLADTATSIPNPKPNQPLGTGQHWEALRNIQMNYGDVLLSTEFVELLDRALSAKEPAGVIS